MDTNKEIKNIVRQKYSQIAVAPKAESGCCSSCSPAVDYSVFSEDYSHTKGYHAEADLGLGCGLPVQFARIKPGDTVVDLGSGAGNDCFVARSEAGARGKVIGIDFSPEMIDKARRNVVKMNYDNVEFHQGDIEYIPLSDGIADVVVSNCVLNLVPDKHKAFSEIFRILKHGGHFSISDVVTLGQLPAEAHKAAELYAGCVTGAITREEYLQIIKGTGFIDIEVQKERQVEIPDKVLSSYLDEPTYQSFKNQVSGIFSINVYGHKPVE